MDVRYADMPDIPMVCSTWEGGETQKCGKDKELPATLGWVDYLGKRLYQADQETERMFGDD